MNWHSLFSADRLEEQTAPVSSSEIRTSYQRDYDRIIFSSAFRRLQNKTQVFPLPGAVMVHNRLTHSLEVSSVGRSLAKITGEEIAKKRPDDAVFRDFYLYEFPSVIAAACLAHDIGNPPFGHSGEEAIRAYFESCPEPFQSMFHKNLSEAEQLDFLKFEGNANAFRTLTHAFNESSGGGYRLTLTTLAAIVKYPCDSPSGFKGDRLATKKSGFFQSEVQTFQTIAKAFAIPKIADENVYARHPFVFLVEAADDICYRIMDFEDAFKLNIVSAQMINELFFGFFHGNQREKVNKRFHEINDENQKVQYLRAVVINYLVERVTTAFLNNEAELLAGTLDRPLMKLLPEADKAIIEEIDAFSRQKIYNHASVVEVEIAGHNVIGGLLDEFCTALACLEKPKSKKLLQLIPKQFAIIPENSFYSNLQSVVDFIAGMTDLYAVEMYKNIKGISFSQLK